MTLIPKETKESTPSTRDELLLAKIRIRFLEEALSFAMEWEGPIHDIAWRNLVLRSWQENYGAVFYRYKGG